MTNIMEEVTIASGLNFNWDNSNRVGVYRITTVSRYVLSQWSQHLITLLEDWSPDKPVRLLYDISPPGVSLTYLLINNRDLFHIGIDTVSRQYVEEKWIEFQSPLPRLAILTSSAMSGKVASKQSRTSNALTFKTQVFFDYITALSWLLED